MTNVNEHVQRLTFMETLECMYIPCLQHKLHTGLGKSNLNLQIQLESVCGASMGSEQVGCGKCDRLCVADLD